MKISFHGAAQEVTGSNYLLEDRGLKILVDCGIWQGQKFSENKNHDPFPYQPQDIKYLFLTHAHLDHCGRIPKLYKEGFRGKIYCTKPTLDFARIMLRDSQRVLSEEAKRENHPPLYSLSDVDNALALFTGVDYHQKIKLENDLEFCWRDAGHILGSGILELWFNKKKVVFSGDLGNPPTPLLQPPDKISEADYLIIESTYGRRVHEDSKERLLLLQSAIYETINLRGNLMIPAFALERTQELLYELNKLVENKDIPQVPVFVDSPLAIEATQIFRQYQRLFNQEAHRLISSGDDVFRFPGLKMTKTSELSKKINEVKAPKIILAGSGMCIGGRISHHLRRYLPDWRSQLLIVGYQVRGSLGRRLLDGEKEVEIMGEKIKVKAKIKAIGAYSAHADQPRLLAWTANFKTPPKKIFVTHGEPEQAQALAQKINGLVPKLGDSIEL